MCMGNQQSAADNPNTIDEQLSQGSGPLKTVHPRAFSARLLACSHLHRPSQYAPTTSVSLFCYPLLRDGIAQKRSRGRRSGATIQLQASTGWGVTHTSSPLSCPIVLFCAPQEWGTNRSGPCPLPLAFPSHPISWPLVFEWHQGKFAELK